MLIVIILVIAGGIIYFLLQDKVSNEQKRVDKNQRIKSSNQNSLNDSYFRHVSKYITK